MGAILCPCCLQDEIARIARLAQSREGSREIGVAGAQRHRRPMQHAVLDMDVVDTRTVAADFFSRRITQRGAVADVVIDAETVRRKLRNEAGQRLRGRSEEHTSELQSLMRISYAVFCLKKKNKQA